MNQKVLHKVFIWGFLFLYLLVALISFCHAVQFFGIGNVKWMSISLAFAFELGLALSLASILLSDKNKKQTLPWILMITLTAVQVVGNVYSVFRYISVSDVDYYQYLAKPLLFFIEEVDENTIQIIVSWIMGAILPIVALMMTDMVANNIKNVSEDKAEPIESVKDKIEEDIEEQPAVEEKKEKPVAVEEVKDKIEEDIEEQPAVEEKKEKPVAVEEVKENLKPTKNKEESIADYIDVLSTTENKKPEVEEKKEEKKPFISKIISTINKKEQSKKNESAVVNSPESEADHLNLRKSNESYFRDPTIKQ